MSSRSLQSFALASTFAICNILGVEHSSSDQRAVVERLRSIGISESYASQLARSKRPPSKPLAIEIFRRTGMKFGPIEGLNDDQIDVLETVVGRGKAKGRAS